MYYVICSCRVGRLSLKSCTRQLKRAVTCAIHLPDIHYERQGWPLPVDKLKGYCVIEVYKAFKFLAFSRLPI